MNNQNRKENCEQLREQYMNYSSTIVTLEREMKQLNDFISDNLFVQQPPKKYVTKYLQFIRKIIRNEGQYLFSEDLDFITKLLNVILHYLSLLLFQQFFLLY